MQPTQTKSPPPLRDLAFTSNRVACKQLMDPYARVMRVLAESPDVRQGLHYNKREAWADTGLV